MLSNTTASHPDTESSHLALALEIGGIGIWEVDIPNRTAIVSERVAQRYGETVSLSRTLSYQEWCDHIHPDDRERVTAALERLFNGLAYDAEYRFIAKDGTVQWIAVKGAVVTVDPQTQKPLRAVGVSRNITEQKQTEEKLRASEAQLRALFENAREAIGISVKGRILYVNPAYALLLGYATPEEMVGLSVTDTIAPSDQQRMQELAVKRAAGELVPILYAYRGRRKDGTELDLENYVSTYTLNGEKYTIVTTRDITERMRTLEEIKELNARLQQAMTETHHRVKNNLQVISSLLELATMNGNESVPTGEIIRLTQHLRSLAAIHDLMTREAKQGGNLDVLSVQAVLENLLPGLQQVMGLDARMIFSTDDAPVTSRQATSLALITNELVTNAVKHGASAVEVRFVVEGQIGRLEVRDNGPGFPDSFNVDQAAHTGLDLVQNLTMWDLRGSAHFGNLPEGGAQVILQIPITVASGRS